MAWFRKDKKPLTSEDRRDVPSDVFDKCPGCGEILYRERLAQNLNVCPDCGHHMRISAEAYLSILLDGDTFQEIDADLRAADPLEFQDLKPYPERIAAAEARGKSEAVVTGRGSARRDRRRDRRDGLRVHRRIDGVGRRREDRPGGPHGAQARRSRCIIVSASGGARMQEGIYSLMQMAKTSVVLARLHDAGMPFVSILTNPTTGGVTASYAMLGDVNLAEPGRAHRLRRGRA